MSRLAVVSCLLLLSCRGFFEAWDPADYATIGTKSGGFAKWREAACTCSFTERRMVPPAPAFVTIDCSDTEEGVDFLSMPLEPGKGSFSRGSGFVAELVLGPSDPAVRGKPSTKLFRPLWVRTIVDASDPSTRMEDLRLYCGESL